MNFEETIQALQAQVEELREELSEQKQIAQILRAENHNLRVAYKQHSEQESEIRILHTDIFALRAEAQKLMQDKETAESEKYTLLNQLIEVKKENQELKDEVAKLRKKLGVRCGTEDPYGINTPSSRKVAKPNSTEENRNKKGGAPVGHRGHGRKLAQDREISAVVVQTKSPEQCLCGSNHFILIKKTSRNLVEIVPAHEKIIRETRYIYQCKECGKTFTSPSKLALDHCSLTNQAVGMLAFEVYGDCTPINKICRKYSVNRGTIIKRFHFLADILEPILGYIKEMIRQEKYIHADETTWQSDGKRGYTWCFVNNNWRLFLFRNTRSSQVPLEVFPAGKDYDIILVTDRYGGYNALPVKHQYCMVHLMRDLKKIQVENQSEEEVQVFCADFMTQLKLIVVLKQKPPPHDEYIKQAACIKRKIMAIAEASARYPDIQKYQDIFRKYYENLFQWVNDPDIPCENNFAERALRQLVVARKISFGCQSDRGMKTREILTSIIQTLSCRSLDYVNFICDVLIAYATNQHTDVVKLFHNFITCPA